MFRRALLTQGTLLRNCCKPSLRCATLATNTTASTGAKNHKARIRYVPRRAVLYVPGSSEKMLKKVPQIEVDCLVLEMEDGVAMNAKVEARQNIRNYLDELPSKGTHKCLELGVRVNSVASELIYDDVKEVAQSENMPEAFMVPKVDSIEDLATVFDAFRTAYGEERISKSDTRLVLWIESARALLDMPRILNAAVNLNKSTGFFKVDAVVFGSDDFCADIGATRTKQGIENMFARQRFVTCCKAFSLQAIDSVYIDIKDKDGLKAQCEEGRTWGFDGKQVIHPSQIDVVQNAFLPSAEKIEWARALMKEFVEHEKLGKGAFNFRGHMIDRPLLLQAMNIVKMVERVNRGRTDHNCFLFFKKLFLSAMTLFFDQLLGV